MCIVLSVLKIFSGHLIIMFLWSSSFTTTSRTSGSLTISRVPKTPPVSL